MVMHTLWLKIIYQYSYPSVCFVFKELSIYQKLSPWVNNGSETKQLSPWVNNII